MARVALVTSGLEHLGIAALAAYVKTRGHEAVVVYEPKPFSSNSGPDSELLARFLEPPPEQTAERILAERPDVVGFSSYTITHKWSLAVARAIKRQRALPIVFGGPHVSGAPEHTMRRPEVDAVVEGEGEGALVDLLECAEQTRFGRSDVPNTWMRNRAGDVVRSPIRPLIEDLDELPWADKSGFYGAIPAFEREFYIVSRRGCPFRCSFCEYSIFPRQYPGARPVRRRTVEHVIRELEAWKARRRIRKVFFWDAIFTLDIRWMEELADAYSKRIGLPFECYTHPQAMTPEMAATLARAGCAMVRVGVQTVNDGTLAAMDRRGNSERVASAIRHLRTVDVPYALDHIIGLPGEGPDDQRAAIRFYNELRPSQIYVHWMTYLPGTTAIERAVVDGILTTEQVERVLTGEETRGYEAPRLVGPGEHKDELDEICDLSVLFALMPFVSRETITLLLESGMYRFLPARAGVQKAIALAMTLGTDVALRERMRAILYGSMQSASRTVMRSIVGNRFRELFERSAIEREDKFPSGPRTKPEARPSLTVVS